MPLDPCFVPIVESIAKMPPPPPDADPVAAARAGTAAMFVHPSPPEVETVDRTILGPAGDGPASTLPVRIYWAVANGAEIGGDPARIAIGGDSAGGNLAGRCRVAEPGRGRAGARVPDARLPTR